MQLRLTATLIKHDVAMIILHSMGNLILPKIKYWRNNNRKISLSIQYINCNLLKRETCYLDDIFLRETMRNITEKNNPANKICTNFLSRWMIEYFRDKMREKKNKLKRCWHVWNMREIMTISRSRKRVRFHWTYQHHRSGSGIEGSARIFAEEMGGGRTTRKRMSVWTTRAPESGNGGCIYAGCPNVLKLSESRMNFLSSLSAIEKASIRSPLLPCVTTLEYIQIPLSLDFSTWSIDKTICIEIQTLFLFLSLLWLTKFPRPSVHKISFSKTATARIDRPLLIHFFFR